MSYSKVKEEFQTLEPEALNGKTGEQVFRWHLLNLLFAIYGEQVGTCIATKQLAETYKELLQLQKGRDKMRNGG